MKNTDEQKLQTTEGSVAAPDPPEKEDSPKNSRVSLNVALFAGSVILCLVGAWYVIGTGDEAQTYSSMTGHPTGSASSPSSSDFNATPAAPATAYQPRFSPSTDSANMTDADVGSEAVATASYMAATPVVALPSDIMASPRTNNGASDPLPPTPAPRTTPTPTSTPMTTRHAPDGRLPVQSNGSEAGGATPLPVLTGNLSPQKIAEQMALQAPAMFNPKTTPTRTPGAGNTLPTAAVPAPSIAVPAGLGNWSVTPKPTLEDAEARRLAGVANLEPSQFLAPTPLPYLSDSNHGVVPPDGGWNHGGGLPPTPTPMAGRPTASAPTPLAEPPPTPTITEDMLQMLPNASQLPATDYSTTNWSPEWGVTPTPSATATPAVLPQPVLTPLPANFSEPDVVADGFSDILPTVGAVPTVPPSLVSRAQGTPRSGVVAAQGATVTPAVPGVVPTLRPSVATPIAAAAATTPADDVMSLEEISDIDPTMARAAKRALANRDGTDAGSDLTPNLTLLPPDIARRIGAGAGLSVQVGDRAFSSELIKKQTDAILKMNGVSATTDQRDNYELRVATDWAERTAVAEYAREQGEAVSDAEVKIYLSELDNRAKRLQQSMVDTGVARSVLDEQAADACLVAKIVKTRYAQEYSNSAQLKAVYDQSPELYQPSRSIHVSEIFKRVPDDPQGAQTVKELMSGIRTQVQQGDFASIATRESDAPSRAKGGDLGWINAASGKITESMATGLADLKQGDVSKVVLGPDGYYLFKLEGVREAQPGFDGARANVEATVLEGIKIGYFEQAKALMNVVIGGERLVPTGASTGPRNAKKAEGNNRSRAKTIR